MQFIVTTWLAARAAVVSLLQMALMITSHSNETGDESMEWEGGCSKHKFRG
jgi:hypothetical protein